MGDESLNCKHGNDTVDVKCVKRDQGHRDSWHPIQAREVAVGYWRLYDV